MCGALSYAELATALPRSGGEYHYLSKIYHPSVGFLSGWISVVVGFPAPIALAGIAFGEYFKVFTPGISPVLISLLVIWVITLVHLFGLRVEEMFQNGSTFLKIGLILVLIVAGLLIANPQPLNMFPGPEGLENTSLRPFRGRSRLRHVRLLGMERCDLYHRRSTEPGKERPLGSPDRNCGGDSSCTWF